MHLRLLALPFILLPLAHAFAADDHAHGSLDAHEHGVAQLNVALEEQSLELELHSPAMNIVGFEHAAQSAQDKLTVEKAKQQLQDPLVLFKIPTAAGCKTANVDLDSPLFAADGDHDHKHSDIEADYELTCAHPEALTVLDLSGLFTHFSATHRVQAQAVTPHGQKGAELTPDASRLEL
ncbi:uncharacterized protein DUF2796 [Pseudomonas duriflava]|uniref:Uncharacterized protein DUF2796 n=1 Tax=Pseudomonas duriflava TaxID=459528 RepID=A0A562Q6V0_9PSED|nr:DUF2796 domain-containing protein [Pseudomonas duriflava]TWI52438.1 uncharacterized protein DUF2796 [Pseudomonas duriflava]